MPDHNARLVHVIIIGARAYVLAHIIWATLRRRVEIPTAGTMETTTCVACRHVRTDKTDYMKRTINKVRTQGSLLTSAAPRDWWIGRHTSLRLGSVSAAWTADCGPRPGDINAYYRNTAACMIHDVSRVPGTPVCNYVVY